MAIAALHAQPAIQGRYPRCHANPVVNKEGAQCAAHIGGQVVNRKPKLVRGLCSQLSYSFSASTNLLQTRPVRRTALLVEFLVTIEIMQPGRPFLRSLQSSFLKHVQGRVHCESDTLTVKRRRHTCLRPEGVDSDPREAPLERSDIVNRVLAAVKACSMVDSAKVTEDANFEEELQLQRGDVVVLVLAVLKKYSLSLSYVEARRITTCAELIDYIESQVCQDDSPSPLRRDP